MAKGRNVCWGVRWRWEDFRFLFVNKSNQSIIIYASWSNRTLFLFHYATKELRKHIESFWKRFQIRAVLHACPVYPLILPLTPDETIRTRGGRKVVFAGGWCFFASPRFFLSYELTGKPMVHTGRLWFALGRWWNSIPRLRVSLQFINSV